jgi:hypothetical protein
MVGAAHVTDLLSTLAIQKKLSFSCGQVAKLQEGIILTHTLKTACFDAAELLRARTAEVPTFRSILRKNEIVSLVRHGTDHDG